MLHSTNVVQCTLNILFLSLHLEEDIYKGNKSFDNLIVTI